MMRSNRHNLFIGTPSNGFWQQAETHYCENIFEGIAAVKQQTYQSICVVWSDLPEPKTTALEALSQFAAATRICLLIDMHEEPDVIALQQSSSRRLFNDYQLFPTKAELPAPQPTQPTPEAGKKLTDLAKDQYIRELEMLVIQDDLTGLKNRRYLRQFLPTLLKYAGQQDCQVTLLLFDLDDFKHYNDTYGHSVGDQVLMQIARLIKRCCRDHDVVARLGGDEFAVVFWDTSDGQTPQEIAERRQQCQNHPRQAQFMAQRFRKEISEAPFEFLGPQGQGTLTISGGLASFPVDGTTAEELFEKADQAMLEAKRSGKNQIEIVGQPTA